MPVSPAALTPQTDYFTKLIETDSHYLTVASTQVNGVGSFSSH